MLGIREYETVYIVRPDISDTDADRVTDRVRAVIRNHEGKIVEVNNWGKRKLAYEIGKQQKGIYVYWRYVGNTSTVKEIERNLRMLEPVLRYLTVQLKEEIDPDTVSDVPDDRIPMRTAAVKEVEDLAASPIGSAVAAIVRDEEDDDDDEGGFEEDDAEER